MLRENTVLSTLNEAPTAKDDDRTHVLARAPCCLENGLRGRQGQVLGAPLTVPCCPLWWGSGLDWEGGRGAGVASPAALCVEGRASRSAVKGKIGALRGLGGLQGMGMGHQRNGWPLQSDPHLHPHNARHGLSGQSHGFR